MTNRREERADRAFTRRRRNRAPDADLEPDALDRLNRARIALGLTHTHDERNHSDGL